MTQRFQNIFFGLLFAWVPLAFFARASDGVTLPKELVAISVEAFFLLFLVWEERWVFRQALFLAFLGFTSWMILDSLVISLLKMEALKGSIHLLLIAGSFLATVAACSRGFRYEKAVHFSLFAAGFMALYGLLQSFGLDTQNWTTHFERRAFATLGNPDYLGEYLAALLPLGFVLTLRGLGEKNAWFWLNLTLLLTLGLFATRVRGAEMAAAAGLGFVGVCLFTSWGRALRERNKLFLRIILILAVTLGGAWSSLHWKNFAGSPVSLQQRLDTYRVAWEMVKDHPWLGIGLGQLGIEFPLYQWKPWVPQDYPLHPYTYSEHVHNELLQFWVEGGLPGILFFLMALGVFVSAAVHFLRNSESKPEEKELLIGVVGGVVALLVQSLSNFPLQIAPTAVLFGFFLAGPLALRKPVARPPVVLSRFRMVLLGLTVLLPVSLGLRAVGASIAFRDTVGESSLGNAKLAQEYGARLVALSPVNPKAWNAYGKALEVADQPDQAYQAYEKSLQLDPDFVENLPPMAQIRLKQGRFAEAVDLCRQARTITPNYALPVWIQAAALFELKHYEEATQGFKDYLAFNPKDFGTHLDLGVCLILSKHKTEAIEEWKKANALNPDDPQVIQYLRANGVEPAK